MWKKQTSIDAREILTEINYRQISQQQDIGGFAAWKTTKVSYR